MRLTARNQVDAVWIYSQTGYCVQVSHHGVDHFTCRRRKKRLKRWVRTSKVMNSPSPPLTWLVVKEFDLPILVSSDGDGQGGMTHHFVDMSQTRDSWARRTENDRFTHWNMVRSSVWTLQICVWALTAVALSLQHQGNLGGLQVVDHHVSGVEGHHHVGRVTAVKIHRRGDAVLCRRTREVKINKFKLARKKNVKFVTIIWIYEWN